MKATSKSPVGPVLLLLAALGGLASCVDERVIFQDRPIYEEPLAAALDFLGYSDREEKLTVCGNCHVGMQAEWENTGHANAWLGLQVSGHAQTSCEKCHTVNALGNVVEGEVGGHLSVEDVRYHDVQCESCHGPGLPHVRNPDALDTRPMASILVEVGGSDGCGECHSGAHHPFVDEWAASPHGQMNPFPAGRDAANGGCYFCHSGEGALLKWGVRADYREKEALLSSATEFADITCAVCHDPHDGSNEGQLRFPVHTPSVEEHLCAQCHNRATVPNAGPRGLSPHAPEAELLAGSTFGVGWIPPGMELDEDTIRGTHGSERNARLCATCHVVPFSTTDELTGGTFTSVGHGFRAIPCIENGVPTGELDCAITTTARVFDGCLSAQCHADATTARSVLNFALSSVLDRAQTLQRQLDEADPNGTDPGGPIDPSDPTFTVAEGAYFNLQLAHHGTDLEPTMTRQDSLVAFAPTTTHNPFLIESLLIWSIQAMEREYGTAALHFDPAPTIQAPPSR